MCINNECEHCGCFYTKDEFDKKPICPKCFKERDFLFEEKKKEVFKKRHAWREGVFGFLELWVMLTLIIAWMSFVFYGGGWVLGQQHIPTWAEILNPTAWVWFGVVTFVVTVFVFTAAIIGFLPMAGHHGED